MKTNDDVIRELHDDVKEAFNFLGAEDFAKTFKEVDMKTHECHGTIITTGFWDCACCNDYINISVDENTDKCNRCNERHDEWPNSHLNEVCYQIAFEYSKLSNDLKNKFGIELYEKLKDVSIKINAAYEKAYNEMDCFKGCEE